MPKYCLHLLLLLLLPGFAAAQKAITLEDCFVFYKFYPESAAELQYLSDGVRYVEADGSTLHVRSMEQEKFDSTIALNLPEAARAFDRFRFSGDEKTLLLRCAAEPVYRHSVLANYYTYDLQARRASPVFETEKQQFVALSPDASRVAFVASNNLYIKDLSTGKINAVTRDGRKNEIINGLPDWVYEEEFSPVDGEGMVACKWSPDGQMLGFLRFDERQVPTMPITWYEGGAYPRQSNFKYPKVGQPNAIVTAHIHDLRSGQTTQLDCGGDPEQYLPRLHWTPDNRLVVTQLNRAQDRLRLLVADAKTGLTYPLLEETDPAYIELENEHKVVFLRNGGWLWLSERSGHQHLHRYGGTLEQGLMATPQLGTANPSDCTPGNFDLTAFYGVDEKNGTFYYQAATPTPLDRQLWEGYLDGRPARLLTPGPGTHEAQFSPSFAYYTHTWQDANTPPVVRYCRRDGTVLRTLTDNARVRQLRREYRFADKTFFQFPLADGTLLNGWMLRPPGADSTRRCPVLFDIYGGPGSQTVQNQYDGYVGSWHQMLLQKGYAVVSVDNRGTGARGRDFKKCTQLQLGKLETEDQIAAARYLRSLPWVDPARIGIWGWSFGGYLSSSCILKGNDVFRMAMAVAPVTNWKWYDSAYTERYMRGTGDNAKGYEENSPVNFATRLRGDSYLICHGIADDNVHWQQTTEMINALIQANKQFDTYYYPNRNHGIHGDNATRHLFQKLTDFVLEKL